MKILTSFSQNSDEELEQYRPVNESHDWELVASGFWSDSIYHSGHIAYYITKHNNLWILDGVERNTELDGVTEEDVKEGRLNDDQIQAMWGISLEEAQNEEYRQIRALIKDAPPDTNAKIAAKLMYEEIRKNDGKIIEDSDLDGLIDL